jgi:hypothetical protein
MSEENHQPMNLWKQENAGIPATAKLRFANCRRPEGVDDLSPLEQQQLVISGQRYDGAEIPIESRLASPDEGGDEEESFYGMLTVWDIVDEMGVVYCTAWFYRVDSGTIFAAGTTQVVAEVIQCGLECDDQTFGEQLIEAAREQRARDPEAAKEIAYS